MKRVLIIMMLMTGTACNFLEPDLDKSQELAAELFTNEITATATVTAMYNSIAAISPLSGSGSGMNALTGLGSGELSNYTANSELLSFQQHQIDAKSSNVSLLWSFLYNLIYQANAVREGIEGSSALSGPLAQQLKGEALFVRAFAYFYLVNLFGDVPLAVSTDYYKNKSLPRASKDEVYELIENDLLLAQSLLSVQYISENKARPNKATATALLARVYLYREMYQLAHDQASLLISDSSYQLTDKDDIDQVFLIGSNETIWQIETVVASMNTVEGNYSIVTTTPNAGCPNIMTPALRDQFEAGDLRRAHWIKSFTNSVGTFYFPYKYKAKTKDVAAQPVESSIVFRLAELYLIRAESRVNLHDVAGAQEDLNIIRNRAGLSNTTATTETQLRSAIERERWSELFTEYGHRWFDLKRTGRAVAVLGGGITENDLLFPLPASEFIKNPHLGEQNPGY